MQKHPATIEQVILWGLLAFGLIMLNGGSVVGDNPPASRWARVDLTQYCGKTVGELIDAVGDDYEYYSDIVMSINRGEYYSLTGFLFEYEDADISIYPTGLVYCNPDLRQGEPTMGDIRREIIARMVLHVK